VRPSNTILQLSIPYTDPESPKTAPRNDLTELIYA